MLSLGGHPPARPRALPRARALPARSVTSIYAYAYVMAMYAYAYVYVCLRAYVMAMYAYAYVYQLPTDETTCRMAPCSHSLWQEEVRRRDKKEDKHDISLSLSLSLSLSVLVL